VDGGKDKDKVPMVNGEPTGFKSRKLIDGDEIEVAGIEMEYRVE
jgi:ribosome-associated protein YbcJ (S4-like RNA binding protein)